MKTILSAILALTFALGASTYVFAADPAVEEAWRNNTRAENLPHEWAIAKREAKAGSQFASSGAIQSDAQSDVSNQNRTQTNTFEDKPWLYAH